VYPRRYFGFALLYFTGSDHFNRSMRLFARKKGWSLSDRYLKRVVRVRKGVKLESGESVVCPEEVDVFIALGLEYKDPTERNCFDIRFLEEDEAQAKKRKSAGDADAGENIPATMVADDE
jgi:DNA polymerase/3'-5' exonuclease PolX